MENEEDYGIFCKDCGRRIEPGDDFIIVDGEFVCDDCRDRGDYEKCPHCGRWFDKEDGESVYCDDDGLYYCGKCVEDGYIRQCEDCSEWHREFLMTEIDGGFYCDCCLDESFVQCYDCDEWIRRDDAVEIGGSWFCDSCSQNWVECRDCGDPVREDDAYRYGHDGYICQCCYEGEYFTCEGCDEVYHNDDAHMIDGLYYCESCADGIEADENPTRVMSYHGFNSGKYLPRRLDSETRENLFFGVELEVEKGRFRECDYEDWTTDDSLIHFEHDGSLRTDGVECITMPCSLKFHQQKMSWKELCDTFLSAGFRSHYDGSHCGLHVHISRTAMTPLSIMKLDVFVNNAKDFLSQIARRSEIYGGGYCVGKRMDKQKGRPQGTHDDRYQPVNTTNYNTVEIRIFRGTLNSNTVLGTIELCHAMVKFMPLIPANRIYNHHDNIKDFISFMADHSEDYPNVFPMMMRLVRYGWYADFVKEKNCEVVKKIQKKEEK